MNKDEITHAINNLAIFSKVVELCENNPYRPASDEEDELNHLIALHNILKVFDEQRVMFKTADDLNQFLNFLILSINDRFAIRPERLN